MKKYAKEYRRKEILEKKMNYKEGWTKLIYSKHAIERLQQRLQKGLPCQEEDCLDVVPEKINISRLNISRGYSYDGKSLFKVVIRLEFNTNEWIYLVILPKKHIVKSLWFANKEQKRRNRKTMGVVPTDMEDPAREEDM